MHIYSCKLVYIWTFNIYKEMICQKIIDFKINKQRK